MTDIKFYSLEPDSRGDQLLLACRLVERIRAKNLSILIYCSEQTQALQLNRLLWTFRQDYFFTTWLTEYSRPSMNTDIDYYDNVSRNKTRSVN